MKKQTAMNKRELDFPEKFKNQISTHVQYKERGKIKCIGTVVELKWSDSYIMNLKTRKEYFGIKLKIKPNDGSRAVWTQPFNSGLKIKQS